MHRDSVCITVEFNYRTNAGGFLQRKANYVFFFSSDLLLLKMAAFLYRIFIEFEAIAGTFDFQNRLQATACATIHIQFRLTVKIIFSAFYNEMINPCCGVPKSARNSRNPGDVPWLRTQRTKKNIRNKWRIKGERQGKERWRDGNTNLSVIWRKGK